MKTFVVNKQDKTRVPFLRGILIRTLIDTGLPFEEALEIANDVRESLGDVEEISVDELRNRISGRLADRYDASMREIYRSRATAPARIRVTSLNGSESAFSRGRHQRFLQASAVRADLAESITTKIFNQLLAAGVNSLTSSELGFLTYLCLQQELGKSVARQYLQWSEFQRSDRPLVLLICGAVGSGKSSIATEIGHRLEIVRTQSTDMLREVMRSMIPKKLLPVLHCSSFDAWKTLPFKDSRDRDKDLLIAEGFRNQADLLALACESVIHRAVRESAPLILEGVHAHPNLMERLPKNSEAVVVHVTLAVMKEEELKARLRGRSAYEPQRRAKRYLKKFDSIWRLQSFVLGEAERCDTAIIPNDDRETAIFQLISTINQEISLHFNGTPANVFGRWVEAARKRVAGKSWQEALSLLVSRDVQTGRTKPGERG